MSKRQYNQIKAVNVVLDRAFSPTVFSIEPVRQDEQGNLFIDVRSALPDRSTFDIVWFRVMGLYLIDDMFVVDDQDDGITVYRFVVVEA